MMWLISATALIVYTAGTRDPVEHRLVIPEGTSALIAEGENPLEIPSTWSFYAGDRLVVDNQDSVTHRIGAWIAPADVITEIILQPTFASALFCTLHPSQQVTLDVGLRGFDIRQTLLPTLGLGIPLGVAAVVVLRVVAALSEPETQMDGKRRRREGGKKGE